VRARACRNSSGLTPASTGPSSTGIFTGISGNPFGIGGLDIKAFYMGFAGCQWKETTSRQLPVQFQPSTQQTHHALDDAVAQAEIFRKLLAASQGKERVRR